MHTRGLASAVLNFNRFPEFVVVVVRAYCWLAIDHYYDDFIYVDLASARRSGLRCLEAVISMIGNGPRHPNAPIRSPELDPSKTQEPGTNNVVLGVHADTSRAASDSIILFTPTPARVDSILLDFRAAFDRGRLTPGEAARLRGRLQFCLVAAYGCVGRAATLPLVSRQYRDVKDSFRADSELYQSLLFFEALLPSLPPLEVHLAAPRARPLLVYTDAAFFLRRSFDRRDATCGAPHESELRGGLGVVIYDPEDGSVRWASGKPDWAVLLSVWPRDRKTYIAQLEVLAAISAYFTFPELFVGRRVHHWVDNTVGLSALVHGYSGKADLAKMVNVFYLQVAGLRTSVYFDYVPSKANIADLPSRDAFDELEHELRGLHVARALPGGLSVPSFLQWRAPLASWVTRFLHLPGNWAA